MPVTVKGAATLRGHVTAGAIAPDGRHGGARLCREAQVKHKRSINEA